MNSKRFYTVYLVFTLMLMIILASNTSFAHLMPSRFVQSMVSQARRSLLNKDVGTANLIFLKYFDMARFGRRCLIDHWDEFNFMEKKNYITLLRQNIQKRMKERLLLTQEDADFTMKTINISNDEDGLLYANILLHIKKGTVPLSLIMVRNEGRFNIVDYEVDGVLLSRQYRASFNRFLRSNNKETFLTKLREKLKV